MPPRYNKKKRISSDEDEDYKPNEEDENDEDENEHNTLMQNIHMTSSGRLIRPSKIKKEPRSGSEEITNLADDGLSNTSKHQPPLRRLKVYDMDKTYVPDFSKISRYLMAVKCTYANAYNKLNNERFVANEPTLARFLRFEDNAIDNNELTRWKKVEEISPSLARWLGTKSVSFVVHGSVPTDILERSEDGNIESERRPLPLKKRGRPRMSIDVGASIGKKHKKDTPPAKLMDKTPITVNERLKSLVDESIALCSVTRETPRGRRTNNSMAIALSQQSSILPPSVSTQRKSLNPTSLQQSSSFSPFPQLKRIKMEIEDFLLPSNFSVGLKNHHYSVPSSKLPSTSQQVSQIIQQEKNKCDQLALEKSNLNETAKTNEKVIIDKAKAPIKANTQIYLNIREEEGAKTNRIALFKAKTFKFDVDQSPAVQRYESIQVIDIFHTLSVPQNDQQTIEEDQQYNQPGTSNMNLEDDRIVFSSQYSDGSMSTIDRLVLRQGKKSFQYAQTLFCGGPLAAISVCPNALPDGSELFAIATFADEESLEWPKNDDNSYIQMWTVNPNELNKPAKLAFLLRVANAPQICSLIWCQSRNNPSTSIASFPLGLLAVGTNNGRILIYRIPPQFDQLLSQQPDIPSPIPSSIILETEPLLTLHHPTIYLNSSDTMLDSIPLFCLQWSPFVGRRHIAAISAASSIHVWDILQDEPKLPHWTLDLEDRQPPPTAISWMENDKICVASRHRQLRIYKLLINRSADNQENYTSFQLISECDTTKSIGSQCFTCPLIFPGIVSFDSIGFNYMGNIQQALFYIWTISNKTGITRPPFENVNAEQICGTNLSNCHQIRLSSASICQQSGICASVGADGRLVCSLNGRMAPRDGLQRDTEVFIYGRTLLQLIGHNKKRVINENEDADLENDVHEDRQKFCYSHKDCCEEKILEIRLGDCALLEQKNERICGRRAPEICMDRRLESLTAVDFSHNTAGLTFCGGDSGLVFIVPCTL